MSWRYSSKSTKQLNTCHTDLIVLMNEALADPACPSDITVLEGYRTEERQNELKAQGASQVSYPNSYHNKWPSMAVDVVPYVSGISWEWEHIEPLAAHIKAVWNRLQQTEQVSPSHRLEWGGDWRWRDGAHYQLRKTDG